MCLIVLLQNYKKKYKCHSGMGNWRVNYTGTQRFMYRHDLKNLGTFIETWLVG